MVDLSNRVHLFAHPRANEQLQRFLSDVLGLGAAVSLHDRGLI